ncbi:MAG: AmmeMemoRadiSam system protein B [Candidatus Marinimicrobia bacterium CG_4_10_14_0_2_um_filter_48_9]|nr:MAG: AmmeMemoRadiSam system protein B [Candidatus Marinimicrobia bacterium CG_4_10_14_0_2_um_filter_48_9]
MHFQDSYRPPQVAGKFYPGSAKAINHYFDQLAKTEKSEPPAGKLLGLISPHAGYIYSAPIAFHGFQHLTPDQFDTVIIIAPSHYDQYEGVSIFPGCGYSTPLGRLNIDMDVSTSLLENSAVITKTMMGHREEHSLEVQLPFLQYFLGDTFKIVPLVMGEQTPDLAVELADAIVSVMTSRTLIVASSDLSHYHDYHSAQIIDAAFKQTLESGNSEELWKGIRSRKFEACGIGPIAAALRATELVTQNRIIKAFDCRNSGDTAGGHDQVVGYLSAGIFEV